MLFLTDHSLTRTTQQLTAPMSAGVATVSSGGAQSGVVPAVMQWCRWLLLERRGLLVMAALLMLGETLLNALIIRFIPCACPSFLALSCSCSSLS
jgi:hypothetical protein